MNGWNVKVATTATIALLGSLACNYTAWPAAVLILAITALGAAEAIHARRIPREAWLLLLPFGYWTLSFLLTRESWTVFFSPEFQRRDGAIFASLLPMAALAALPMDRDRIRGALLAYLVIQAAIALAGGVSVLGGWTSQLYHPAEVVDQKPTFFGLYVAHNATASVYALLTLGALAWALRRETEGRLRIVLLTLAAVLALGCIMARSRGAFVALGAGVAFIVFRALRQGASRRVMTAAIAGLVVALLAGGGLLWPRFQRMIEGDRDEFRREVWSRAWGHVQSSPVVGIGFGRFNDRDLSYTSIGIGRIATSARVENDDRHAHNSYLHWMAEGGLVGLGVMIAFWILVARNVGCAGPLRDTILAGIVTLAVLSLTEHYAGGGIFLTHLAFLIGIHRTPTEESPAS